MADGPWDVIFSYTDREAVEDGVLVPWNGPQNVNRITRAVFDHFAPAQSDDRDPDLSRLRAAVDAMLKIRPDEGGWRTGTHEREELWLIPNEIGGLTLMFPSDY